MNLKHAPFLPPTSFDPRRLLDDLGGDQDVFGEVVRLFCEDVPPRLAAAREALASGDAPGLVKTAHRLAGGLSNFYVDDLLSVARELEYAARRGELTAAPTLLGQLEDGLRWLVEELRRVSAGNPVAAR